VVWAFVGIMITVGFGYAQFHFVGQVQPGKFGRVSAYLENMIAIGEILQFLVLFLLLPLLAWNLLARWRWLHPLLMLVTPLPFAAVILGWLTREIGRQPWLVYGRLTVADAMSPGLTKEMVTASFAGFAGVLGLLTLVDYLLIARAVRRGPGGVALGATGPVPSPEPAPALSY
jgi:cytochrome d ubiquinol oxidase subunit I